MPRLLRLDAELVRRGMARSRDQARELVLAHRVTVGGTTARKPATSVATDADIVVRPDDDTPTYASRGGHKLAGALAATLPRGLVVTGRRCLDAGASTGGFTDVLLRHGASRVLAVDVGYGQLAWALRTDDRVQVHDRTNVRELTLEDLVDPHAPIPAERPAERPGDPGAAPVAEPVDLVVGDLSFISLRLVLPALSRVTAHDGDLLLMVKPQFEVGRSALGKGGVVREPAMRAQAVHDVATTAAALGWGGRAVVTSPLPGPSGNVEFFLWLRRDAGALPVAALHDEVEGLSPEWRPGSSVPDERVGP